MTDQMTTAMPADLAGMQDGLKQAAAIADAFPDIDPGMIPLGSRVIVQLKQPKTKVGRILLTDETKDAEKWNTQVARVVAVGPVAFRSRQDLDEWPERAWVQVGDFVRVPKYNGDRIEVPFGDKQKALFVVFNDLELIAKVTGDPLAIVAYV